MSKTVCAASFQAAEWIYVAALKGAGTMVGTPDPFNGWLAHEVEDTLRQARTSLMERGLLAEQADGTVRVTQPVDRLVTAATAPAVTVILSHHRQQGDAIRRYYQIAGAEAVEQSGDLAGTRVDLVGLESVDQVPERIGGLLELQGFQPAPSPEATLPEESWSRAGHVAREAGAQAAFQVLAAAGIPVDGAQRWAEALAGPVVSGSLVVVRQTQADWEVPGVAYLAGDAGLWLIQRVYEHGQRWVRVAPAGGKSVIQEFGRILERSLSRA